MTANKTDVIVERPRPRSTPAKGCSKAAQRYLTEHAYGSLRNDLVAAARGCF